MSQFLPMTEGLYTRTPLHLSHNLSYFFSINYACFRYHSGRNTTQTGKLIVKFISNFDPPVASTKKGFNARAFVCLQSHKYVKNYFGIFYICNKI